MQGSGRLSRRGQERHCAFGLVIIASWSIFAASQAHQEYTGNQSIAQEDFILKVNGACLLTGKFLLTDTRCWVTSVAETPRAVGEHSYCHVISGPERGLFKCKRGLWVVAVHQEESVKRAKRFLFWRRRRRRSYRQPAPPNQPPYFTSCPSPIHEIALANQRTAVVTWSVLAADDRSSPTVSQDQGLPPESSFNEGETTIRYTARDSAGLTATCLFTVSVSVIRCPDVVELSHFPHGSQSCNGIERLIYGSVCQHSCDPGYELQGQPEVTCQSSGSWNSSFPTCQAVSCGAPGMVPSGEVTCPDGHVFPNTCFLKCLPGYQPQDSEDTSITCGSSGQWSSQLSPCIDTEPPEFPNGCPPDQQLYSGPLESPVAVTWDDPVATDNSGKGVTLTSDLVKGSQHGPGTYIVRVTGRDEAGNEVFCSFVVIIKARKCKSLMPPAHGEFSCTWSNVEGSECTVSCSLGYRLEGTATLLCLETQQWNNSVASCEAILCPIPSISHGDFLCPSVHQHPALCSLTCWQGFAVQAPRSIQCLENATWSMFGSCHDTQAPTFVNGCPPDINLIALPLGSDTVVTWTPPDVTDNSREAVDLQSDVMPGASFPPGKTFVTYVATDVTGNSKSCQFSVNVTALYCEDPSRELSQNDMQNNDYICVDGHVHGARCAVSCVPGYTLVGQGTIKCEKDNRTHPPTMLWRWDHVESGRPVCREDRCPTPPLPRNGALSCHYGNRGPDCILSCHLSYDLAYNMDEHVYCINEAGQWYPSEYLIELGCVKRKLPHRQIVKSSMFYFANDCNTSVEELRHRFVIRINKSIFQDACIHVASCTAENVKVTCGPVGSSSHRDKRWSNERMSPEEEDLLHRAKHTSTHLRPSHYYLVTFEVHMAYVEDLLSAEQTYLNYMHSQTLFRQKLLREVREGKLDVGDVVGEEGGVGPSSLLLDCPPGTLLRPDHDSWGRFSCVGCPKDHYMVISSHQCVQCPQGQYTEVDDATTCTPCPPGQATPSTGAHHSSQCVP